MAFQSYRELDVWQASMSLVLDVYQIIRLFPSEERYALSDQVKRAAVSIPSNIAEGHGRNSVNEFIHFLSISRGSLYELQTQFEIAHRLYYLSDETFNSVCDKMTSIDKMIHALSNYLKSIK